MRRTPASSKPALELKRQKHSEEANFVSWSLGDFHPEINSDLSNKDRIVIKTLRLTKQTCLLWCQLVWHRHITRTWKLSRYALWAWIHLTHSAVSACISG